MLSESYYCTIYRVYRELSHRLTPRYAVSQGTGMDVHFQVLVTHRGPTDSAAGGWTSRVRVRSRSRVSIRVSRLSSSIFGASWRQPRGTVSLICPPVCPLINEINAAERRRVGPGLWETQVVGSHLQEVTDGLWRLPIPGIQVRSSMRRELMMS